MTHRFWGHPGQWKTLELISRNYWWPGITQKVNDYVSGDKHALAVRGTHHSRHTFRCILALPHRILRHYLSVYAHVCSFSGSMHTVIALRHLGACRYTCETPHTPRTTHNTAWAALTRHISHHTACTALVQPFCGIVIS